MTFAEGAVRFILGGTLVLVIGIVAKNGRSTLAGVIAMFPVITAVSYSFMVNTVDITVIKSSVLSSVLSLPATLGFLLAFYFCLGKWSFTAALLFSFGVWIAAAIAVYLLRP